VTTQVSPHLLVVDPTVANYQVLLAGVSHQFDVILLKPHEDGIRQISDVLAKRTGIQSLHILSHGSPGSLYLGRSFLNRHTLNTYSASIAQWATALAPDAEIFLYGCNVAETSEGQQFVNILSELTGAAIAASTTLTGATSLGGTWDLGYRTGSIQTPLAFSSNARADYPVVLILAVPNLLFAVVSVNVPTAQIYTIDTATGVATRVGELQDPRPGTPTANIQTFAIARVLDPTTRQGLLYFIENGLGDRRVGFWNPETLETTVLNTIPASQAGGEFIKMAQSQDGTIYAKNASDNILYVVNATTGTVSQYRGAGAIAGLPIGSGDMAFDPNDADRLIISSLNGGVLRLYSVDISAPTLTATQIGNGLPPLGGNGIGSLAFGANANLYLSSTAAGNQRIFQVDENTGAIIQGPLNVALPGTTSLPGDLNDFGSLPTTTDQVNIAINVGGDLPAQVETGQRITFTLQVRNTETVLDVEDIRLISNLPSQLTNVTWRAQITLGTGGFPGASSGTGNQINNLVNLNAGSVATYTVTATVAPGTPVNTVISVTAQAFIPPGLIDRDPTNNQFQDSTLVVANVVVQCRPGTPIIGNAGDNQLVGADGFIDTIDGQAGNDTLLGLGCPDRLFGNLGNDLLNGGAANDTLNGGAGSDRLFGEDGDDLLQGGNDSDILRGAGGNDTLQGGSENDTLSGGAGNDQLEGNAGADNLFGDAGQDLLIGGVGRDLLDGGSGNDRLFGQDSEDFLLGGDGNDLLNGGAGDDTLSGGSSADNLQGQNGNDRLSGDAGNDTLRGGAGNDTLLGRNGNDVIGGDEGNDLINGGAGNDSMGGAGGNDFIAGDAGDDVLYGRTGNDRLEGGQGNDQLFGGGDNDLLDGGGGNDQLEGDFGDDRLIGGAGNDLVLGGAGDDILNGVQGADTLNGDGGNDQMFGGIDNDLIFGGSGNDVVVCATGDDIARGEAGNDRMAGNAGNDLLNGGDGNDLLDGGNGDDILNGGAGADRIFGQFGDDNMRGEQGSDTLFGGDGNDSLVGLGENDILYGNAGNDLISGGLDDDFMAGGLDNDTILGNFGRDSLFGEAGNDLLTGGRGQDFLTGGAGADTFAFETNSEGTVLPDSDVFQPDQILDFNQVQGDRFRVSFTIGALQNRPTGLFNAGTVTAANLSEAVSAAFADRNFVQPGPQPAAVRHAIFFNWRQQTYLGINNRNAGFNPQEDLVINVNNMVFRPGDQSLGALNVSNYFA